MSSRKEKASGAHADDAPHAIVTPQSLSVRQAVILLAIIRLYSSEDFRQICLGRPSRNISLSPLPEDAFRYFEELGHLKIMKASASTVRRGVPFLYGMPIQSVSRDFVLDFTPSSDPALFVRELDQRIAETDWSSSAELFSIAIELNQAELFAFLRLQMQDHRLKMPTGEKTREVIRKIVLKFPLSWSYRFAYLAVKHSAAYAQMSRDVFRASNSVVGNLERLFERAVAESWESKAFRRNFHIPQSALSEVVFNAALKRFDGGFEFSMEEIFDSRAFC